jgi:hypothetical protein
MKRHDKCDLYTLASITNTNVTDVLSSRMLTQYVLRLFNVLLVFNLYIQNSFKFIASNLTWDWKDAWKFCFPSVIRTPTNYMATLVSFVYKSTVLLASYYTAPPSLDATASVWYFSFIFQIKSRTIPIQLILGGHFKRTKNMWTEEWLLPRCDAVQSGSSPTLGLKYCLYLHIGFAFSLLIVGYLLGLFIDVENGGSRSPQNVGKLLPDCTS